MKMNFEISFLTHFIITFVHKKNFSMIIQKTQLETEIEEVEAQILFVPTWV